MSVELGVEGEVNRTVFLVTMCVETHFLDFSLHFGV